MLPIGFDRGLCREIFTLWKGTKEAARIKVQSTDKGFVIIFTCFVKSQSLATW